jgi:hypothetical protein
LRQAAPARSASTAALPGSRRRSPRGQPPRPRPLRRRPRATMMRAPRPQGHRCRWCPPLRGRPNGGIRGATTTVRRRATQRSSSRWWKRCDGGCVAAWRAGGGGFADWGHAATVLDSLRVTTPRVARTGADAGAAASHVGAGGGGGGGSGGGSSITIADPATPIVVPAVAPRFDFDFGLWSAGGAGARAAMLRLLRCAALIPVYGAQARFRGCGLRRLMPPPPGRAGAFRCRRVPWLALWGRRWLARHGLALPRSAQRGGLCARWSVAAGGSSAL